MKTLLKKLAIKTLSIVLLSTVAFSSQANANVKAPRAVLLANNFKRILVSGNVELLVVQNKKEGIVYDNANEGKAIVFKEGDLVRISSTGTQRVKLILYVNDFYRIDASENAIVKNYGVLDLKYLQVFLKDNATAEINSNTTGLYTVLNNNANLKLNGHTNDHILARSKEAKLTLENFYASNTENNPEEFLATTK